MCLIHRHCRAAALAPCDGHGTSALQPTGWPPPSSPTSLSCCRSRALWGSPLPTSRCSPAPQKTDTDAVPAGAFAPSHAPRTMPIEVQCSSAPGTRRTKKTTPVAEVGGWSIFDHTRQCFSQGKVDPAANQESRSTATHPPESEKMSSPPHFGPAPPADQSPHSTPITPPARVIGHGPKR